MMKRIRSTAAWGVAACLVVLTVGCTSNGSPRAETTQVNREVEPRRDGFPRITLDSTNYPRLGDAVRELGESTGGGVVLLAGMEEIPVAPVQLNAADYLSGIRQLVSARPCTVQAQNGYVFVYPPGYEQLAALTVAEFLPSDFARGRANFAVGAGTRLPNALALLSDAYDTAVVADNVVAEAWCGELFLESADFTVSLEAILKSALILPGGIRVVASDNYVLIRSVENRNAAPALLNPDGVTPRQRERLAATTSLRLPPSVEGVAFADRYMPLASVLPALTEQLGVEITAEPGMANFPVDAVVLNGVSTEDVLNLTVWQWPLPHFGYRATEEGFHFCQREIG